MPLSMLTCLMMLGLMLWPSISHGQFGGSIVYDPSNYARNLITSLETMRQVQLDIQNLSLLQDLSDYTATLTQATRLASALLQLGTRMTGRYTRWIAIVPSGDTIPCTVSMLLSWNRVYDEDTKTSVLDAGFAQTLVTESSSLLGTISQALSIAQGIAGSVSGLQSLHSMLAKLVMVSTTLQGMRGPMDEGETRVKMRDLVNAEATQILSENRRAGMHGRARRTCTTMTGM